MPTDNLSDALTEAYATTKGQPEYYCFEFVCASLWGENNARIVYGWENITAKLEDGAPGGNGGEMVDWLALPIEFKPSSLTPSETPVFGMEFYDVSRVLTSKIITGHLGTPAKVEMYARVYLKGRFDLGPENNPIPRYHVGNLEMDPFTGQVTGDCVFQDFSGRSAPFRTFTLAEYPNLRRR